MTNVYIKRADAAGVLLRPELTSSAASPVIVRDTAETLVIRLYDDSLTQITDFGVVTSWRLVVKAGYSPRLPILIEADSVTAADGVITAVITATNSDALAAVISDKGGVDLIAQLSGRIAVTDAQASLVVQFGLRVVNTLEAAAAAGYATIQYSPEIAGLKYSTQLGYYADLTNVGDSVRPVYNAADCVSVAVRVRSANPAVGGPIMLVVLAGGVELARAVIVVDATAAWHEITLTSTGSGPLAIRLEAGLEDNHSPVSVIVDGVRLASDFQAAVAGRLERQVAAKPVLYSDAAGYYMSLDAAYSVNFVYPVSGITAVALKLKSANSAITGNVALTLTVGAATKSAVIAVGASDAWTLITLDTPASGAVAVVRDTTNAADTLNDSGTVVSAVVSDLNYYYQEN